MRRLSATVNTPSSQKTSANTASPPVPPPRRRDLAIGDAGQALADLPVAVAGVGEVGVRVDEAGHDQRAARVERLRAFRDAAGGHVRLGAHVGDAAAPNDEGGPRNLA